jgi:hypothetical protein
MIYLAMACVVLAVSGPLAGAIVLERWLSKRELLRRYNATRQGASSECRGGAPSLALDATRARRRGRARPNPLDYSVLPAGPTGIGEAFCHDAAVDPR